MGNGDAGFAGKLAGGAQAASAELQRQLEKLLTEVVNDIPVSHQKKLDFPDTASRALASGAARDASLLTGALAIPGGPLGILTMLPDLVSVWRRQAQLVADIAAVHGRGDRLDREVMMYCLFKHMDGDAVKDILVRAGQRVAVSYGARVAVFRVVQKLASTLVQKLTARFLVHWVPILGAASVAAYTYKDTKRVGETAIRVFGGMQDEAPAKPRARKKKKQ